MRGALIGFAVLFFAVILIEIRAMLALQYAQIWPLETCLGTGFYATGTAITELAKIRDEFCCLLAAEISYMACDDPVVVPCDGRASDIGAY